jgi:hypothetical protein
MLCEQDQDLEVPNEEVRAAKIIKFYTKGFIPAKKQRREINVAKRNRYGEVVHFVLNKNRPMF